MTLTHAQLVVVARKWLERRCAVVTSEVVTQSETPDALGWCKTLSILVECKTSTADFCADRHKVFRRLPELGVGQKRYFLTPIGLVSPASVPQGWGLLETDGKRVRTLKESALFKANVRHEVRILLSLIRRIGSKTPTGVSVRFFVHQTRCNATLSVDSPAQSSDITAA